MRVCARLRERVQVFADVAGAAPISLRSHPNCGSIAIAFESSTTGSPATRSSASPIDYRIPPRLSGRESIRYNCRE